MRYVLLYGSQNRERLPICRKNELVFLIIDALSLFEKESGIRFTDGNAAGHETHFYSDIVKEIDEVDWDTVREKEYSGQDKATRQAELLVHREVPANMIRGIITCDQSTKQELTVNCDKEFSAGCPSKLQGIPTIEVRPDFY